MLISIDKREQLPFAFTGAAYPDTVTRQATLDVGDYSIHGLHDYVAVERKSLADLVQCLGRQRDRFKRELLRARGLECFCVVVEADYKQLAQGEYRSKLPPKSAVQSVASFMARHRVPFMFCGSRRAAEYVTWSILKQYAQGERHRFDAIRKATADTPTEDASGPSLLPSDTPKG